jgi:hypothetical protein
VADGSGAEAGVVAELPTAAVVVGCWAVGTVGEPEGTDVDVVAGVDPAIGSPGPGVSAAAVGSDCGVGLLAGESPVLMPMTSAAQPATATVEDTVATIRPTDM